MLKVTPSSPGEGITGWMGGSLKVRVRAPAERGKANAAVEKIVAESVRVAKDSVRIVTGKTSRQKVIENLGLSKEEVYRRLGKSTS